MAYDADVIVVGAGLAGLVATAELVDAGKKVILLDQEPEQSIGGQAHWSFGGLFLVDSPEQRRMRIKDSRALALQDWYGTAGFDRAEDHWPRQWAEAYVDFAMRREAGVAARPGSAVLPRGGLGRAGRLRRQWAWELRPPLPHHLGHRTGHRGPLRAEGAGGRRPWPRSVQVQAPGDGSGPRRRSGGHRDRGDPGAVRRRARDRVHPDRHRLLRAYGAGGHRDQRRHRRQPRPREVPVAPAARHPARAHAVRRPRPCGRADAGHRRTGGRAPHQPRPDVALHRGHPELEPDLGPARHPHPARTLLALAGRARQPHCPCRSSPVSTPSARSTTS